MKTSVVVAVEALLTFLVAASAMQCVNAANDEWPMFRHDAAHRGYSSTAPLAKAPIEIWSNPSEVQGVDTTPAGRALENCVFSPTSTPH